LRPFPFSHSIDHFSKFIIFFLRILFPYWIATGRVVGLKVSILRVVDSYPTQWTSMYVLLNPDPYGTG